MTKKDYEKAINQLMKMEDEQERDQAVFVFLNFFKEEKNFDQDRFIQVLNKSMNKKQSR